MARVIGQGLCRAFRHSEKRESSQSLPFEVRSLWPRDRVFTPQGRDIKVADMKRRKAAAEDSAAIRAVDGRVSHLARCFDVRHGRPLKLSMRSVRRSHHHRVGQTGLFMARRVRDITKYVFSNACFERFEVACGRTSLLGGDVCGSEWRHPSRNRKARSAVDPGQAGRLDPEEEEIIRRHPVIGYDLLKGVSGISPEILDGVRHHHEYLDGSGYPDGLAASQISDLVRLLTIADIFAALVESRSYRPPMSRQDAYQILCGMEGKLEGALFKAFEKWRCGVNGRLRRSTRMIAIPG